jgi:UDP-N-acetyl-2-amino-2-deoxyglucuronate dehydrogenase
MSAQDLRLALIGTGSIARHHISSMADLKERGLDGFVVTAVCDINEESAGKAADALETHLGLRPTVYSDYERLLENEQLDGVDICLPHGLHHTATIDFMEAGVDVLCEKPAGITVKASRLMAEVADRTGRILSIAVPVRRLRGQRAVRWALNDAQMIGRPLAFFHHHAGPLRTSEGQSQEPRMLWRYDRLMSGGRHVIDSGFHYCDTMRYFLGEVDKVYAEIRALRSGNPQTLDEAIEDAIFATFTFENGVVGTWTLGLILPGEESANIIFYGSEGSLRDTTEHAYRIFHLFRQNARAGREASGVLTKADGTEISFAEIERQYLATLDEEEREYLFPHGVADGFSYEIWEFLELLRGNRDQPEVDGWEGLRSLAVAEAIYESASIGEVVRVRDVISGEHEVYQAPINAHWHL